MPRLRSTMNAEPNVTPFLDVLLVLLIIFMYLSLSQQKAIMAQLPDPTRARGENTPAIVMEVRPNGVYAINTQVVTGAQLASRLRGIYDRRLDKAIIVHGAPGVRYQEVVTAIDVANGAGVVAIGLK